jgi:regulator of RNase E activity RraA
MKPWTTDEELFLLAERELFTCAVGDVMDKMQLFHQFLPSQIRPLDPESVLIDRATTVLSGDVFQQSDGNDKSEVLSKPSGLMLEALDDLRRDEICLNTGSSPRNSTWGEMMSTRATALARAERSSTATIPTPRPSWA